MRRVRPSLTEFSPESVGSGLNLVVLGRNQINFGRNRPELIESGPDLARRCVHISQLLPDSSWPQMLTTLQMRHPDSQSSNDEDRRRSKHVTSEMGLESSGVIARDLARIGIGLTELEFG